MKITERFFLSKVARRFFILFVFCTLIPIAVLSAVTFFQVKEELYRQGRIALQYLTKYTGMAVFERLLLLETEMQIAAAQYIGRDETPSRATFRKEVTSKALLTLFSAMSVVQDGRIVQEWIGPSVSVSILDEAVFQQALSQRRTVIYTDGGSAGPPGVYMVRLISETHPEWGFLVGRINTQYLWGHGENASVMPYMTELSILNTSQEILYSSFPGGARRPEPERKHGFNGASASFDYQWNGNEYLACYWTLFLQSHFSGDNWTVVLSQDKKEVLAPMRFFKQMFPLVLLLSFWVVLLISVFSIRKNLVPLEKLKAGTLRIAERDFKTRVDVESGDEFEELAESFNLMTGKLDRQFRALTAIGEIDRMILSSLETDRIIEIVLTRMQEIIPCQSVMVCLLEGFPVKMIRYRMDGRLNKEGFPVSPADLRIVGSRSDHLILDKHGEIPPFLFPALDHGADSVLIFPVFLQGNLTGLIVIGVQSGKEFSASDIDEARQMADHVAIALSKAELINELDRHNWGTMMALARTVDAKSPWTAGHSERVTDLALKIARKLGVPATEIDILHRACLLHDIGKVGIPLAILDKEELLSEEEFEKIKEHPRSGARILEPIGSYEKVIPIVIQHHERYDGSGYPFGYAGPAINHGARILAVADVYDSLFNNRPYRKGWPQTEVIQYIRQQAGIHFDPDVVRAFLEVIDGDRGGEGPC
ncbi:MAG: HD domain-containing phosphohydrolase [Thermodesulfobacteriota bacterium]